MNLFDLIAAFFRWCGKVLKQIWQLCIDSLHLWLRYWYISLPMVIICIGAGLYYSRPSNRIYKAEAIVYLNGPINEDVRQVMQPVVNSYYLLPNQEIGGLLGLSGDEANGLRLIEALNVIDFNNDSTADAVDYKKRHNLKDTINVVMPNVLCLRFFTKRTDNVQVVGEHLLDYINKNEQLQAKYAKKKVLLERKAQFCHDQLEKLDSLTTSFYFEQGGAAQAQMKWGNGMVLGRREIKLINPEIMEMYKQTEKVDRELALCTAPVVQQQKFTIIPRAVNGRLKCSFIGLVAGYLLGCLIALAVKRRKDLQEWLQKD